MQKHTATPPFRLHVHVHVSCTHVQCITTVTAALKEQTYQEGWPPWLLRYAFPTRMVHLQCVRVHVHMNYVLGTDTTKNVHPCTHPTHISGTLHVHVHLYNTHTHTHKHTPHTCAVHSYTHVYCIYDTYTVHGCKTFPCIIMKVHLHVHRNRQIHVIQLARQTPTKPARPMQRASLTSQCTLPPGRRRGEGWRSRLSRAPQTAPPPPHWYPPA